MHYGSNCARARAKCALIAGLAALAVASPAYADSFTGYGSNGLGSGITSGAGGGYREGSNNNSSMNFGGMAHMDRNGNVSIWGVPVQPSGCGNCHPAMAKTFNRFGSGGPSNGRGASWNNGIGQYGPGGEFGALNNGNAFK